MRLKCVAVAGPTACGKSDVAIRLAAAFGGEIISADSRQVFRGMDIGSGKVSGKIDLSFKTSEDMPMCPFVSDGIRHWLIDVAGPCDDFSAADFQRLALMSIRDISSRGRNVFVAGGTGFFLRSLTDGLDFPEISVSAETRDRIRSMSDADALDMLLSMQPDAQDTIDIKNPRRVARALELLMSGMPSLDCLRKKRDLGLDFLTLGITYPQEVLRIRIEDRLERRFKVGMIEEIAGLLKSGVPRERLESFGLEYRWITKFVCGDMAFMDMRDKLFTEICRFAKRQMTWFRKYCNVVWIDNEEQAFRLVSDFLEAGDAN